ncbi:MAG: alanine--glyoxylate aminotransferase family protein [Gemmatimonadetes bacterium]|nr:alanine--glyoxylate aminotransferase family protein [Gemmatimonadota bacterium]
MSVSVPAPAFGRFFLPGPTDVHPDVLAAMLRPMIGHRSSAMEQILKDLAPKLGALCRTARPVVVGTTSATGFMEMAVRNGVRRRALSIVNGAFSERFAKVVHAAGKECIRLDVPLGAAVEPDMLRDALRRTPVDAVTVVHSETSTGVLQDVDGFARVTKEFDDVLLLVDAVTSMAGSPVEPDRWGLDFTFTGSQKALALPPGLALGVASPRMMERARTLEGRGLYFDLVSFEQATLKFQPTNTPALSLVYALQAQMDRIERDGGVETRWCRHEAMRRCVEAWAAERGIAFLPCEGRRSWTVSCLKLPAGKSAKDVVGALKEQGWTIGSGYGALKDTTIRIGHMGDHTVAALEELLAVLARALARPQGVL